ncbi:MAG TPA: hypothetical protein VN580_04055, partial [Clostridia bacterium]|nr:hypothetical protein [Clostridia bacterium]
SIILPIFCYKNRILSSALLKDNIHTSFYTYVHQYLITYVPSRAGEAPNSGSAFLTPEGQEIGRVTEY